jgi:hypothetical protein
MTGGAGAYASGTAMETTSMAALDYELGVAGASANYSSALAAEQAAGSLFGGAFKIGELGLGEAAQGALMSKALDFGASAFAPEPPVNWGTTEEGLRAKMASDEKIAGIRNSLSSGGGTSLPWSSSEPGVKYQKGMDYQMNSENNAARLAQLDRQYKLQKEQTTHEYELTRKPHEQSAVAGTSGGYQGSSQSVRDAIVAQQRAQGYGQQQTALAGPQEMEA